MRAAEKVRSPTVISSLNDYTFYKRSGFWVTKANTIFVATAASTAVIINFYYNEPQAGSTQQIRTFAFWPWIRG